MPRNSSGVYSKPSGTTAVTATTASSSAFNTLVDDMVVDLNTARPIVAGGTGATTAAGARTNLGLAPEGTTAAVFYGTRAEIAGTSIAATVDVIRTAGYAAEGDGGGALYERSASEPTHPFKVQSSDGAWWEGVPDAQGINPVQFGAAGDGTTNDAAAFASVASYIDTQQTAGDWRSGFNQSPSILDLVGKTYVLSSNVHIEHGVHLRNGKLLMNSCTLTLGAGVGGVAKSVYLSDLDVTFSGTADYAGAMIAIPAMSGGYIADSCTFDAGRTTNRARYGVYVGEEVAFGNYFGGTWRGGECAFRCGKERDNTSNTFNPKICDRSRTVNLLLCNIKGGEIKGDIEHSEDCLAIAITSQTNGSGDVAEAFKLSCGYSFNAGVTAASSDGNVAIQIGHDVPGTTGWDDAGVEISSGDNARMFSISDMYVVTNHVETFFKINAQGFIDMERITWGGAPSGSNPQKFAVFSGACLETRIKSVRNQNTGATIPTFSSTATNRIKVTLPGGEHTPNIRGDVTAGSVTYTARGATWWVMDSILVVQGFMNWSASSGFSGDLEVTLPALAVPAAGNRAVASLQSGGFGVPLNGLVFAGGNVLELYSAGGVRITDASMPGSGNIHYRVEMPLELAS